MFRSFEATFGQGFRFMVRDPRNTKAQGPMFWEVSWPVSVGGSVVVWLVGLVGLFGSFDIVWLQMVGDVVLVAAWGFS